MDSRIQQYLDEQQLSPAVQQVVPLTGDASDRKYFRAHLAGGESVVLALHAGPIDVAVMPFVSVADLLRRMPLPVPRILHHSNALGILGLEDLGDVTLQAHLGLATPDEHRALYRQAVQFIATLQQQGAVHASSDYPPYGIAFDVEKLTWELDFFVKHYLVAYRGVAVTPVVREALGAEWAGIVQELAAEPRVLCHRDYHSRNLMWHRGALYIIDFQDARMGPDTYDLASLLRDSYVDLLPGQVEELIDWYLALTRTEVTAAARTEFRRRFDLAGLQRNLKALGTFGYQTTARGNPVYIQYMPRTLRSVQAALQVPRFARLASLLGDAIPELR
jgi:hypothetical protein